MSMWSARASRSNVPAAMLAASRMRPVSYRLTRAGGNARRRGEFGLREPARMPGGGQAGEPSGHRAGHVRAGHDA